MNRFNHFPDTTSLLNLKYKIVEMKIPITYAEG